MTSTDTHTTSTDTLPRVRCGNHGRDLVYHLSVAEVRECFATAGSPVIPQIPAPALAARVGRSPSATNKQRDFIAKLRAGRGLEPLPFTGSVVQASAEIERLMALPEVVVSRSEASAAAKSVQPGRYAIERDERLHFFVVDRPTEGTWAGRTFLHEMASDEKHPVRGERYREVLMEIASDPEAASKRYGREIGQCGVCGRTLTDAASRAAGIGPICAGKSGW